MRRRPFATAIVRVGLVRSMTPLDLKQAAPRSAREELRGLCMLPRMIDIARAKLPGGDPGEYQLGRGVSAIVLEAFALSVRQFVDIVSAANRDGDVAERLWPAARISPRALSARLQRITVADVPADLRLEFQRLYGADIPADRHVFDVFDADDARAFSHLKPKQ